MFTVQHMDEAFARNVSLIKRQADGLTHEDSLRQPPFRGNCLNWVVGHIAANRDLILQSLGAEPIMGPAGQRYLRESEPIVGEDPGVVPLGELLNILDRSQAALAAALARAADADLAREMPAGQGTTTVGERIFFRYFHDTYHTGQTEMLRQLAGKNDKII